jgi:Na+-transporting NADH:ubiquinone oxidoreductase subunit NqrC
MVAAAAVFTGAITTLDVATRDLAERNEKLKIQRWIVATYELYALKEGAASADDLSDDEVVDLYSRRVDRVRIDAEPDADGRAELRLYVVYATDRTFAPLPDGVQWRAVTAEQIRSDADRLGVAIPLRGIGFWEEIRGWLAMSADLDTVRGVTFVQHGETPGLGGKITTDKKWLGGWAGKNVSAPAAGEPYFYVTSDPDAAPSEDRRIDALTAATQTSNALQEFGNKNIGRFRRAMAPGEGRQE